ncbi:unnamed protein product [Polarella glacialis]|uniref:Uncharacterized protein n=1 Tax=Polarella glacialis TaxID=89957 RepID=A0A813KR01_POLGL|nr:unnamed protein product [Polarella glacialis]
MTCCSNSAQVASVDIFARVNRALLACTFKMMLVPKPVSDRKGALRRPAWAWQIKPDKTANCTSIGEAGLGTAASCAVRLNVSVGTGRPDSVWQSPIKEPVYHNFEECGVCQLPPRQEDEWNFTRAVDEPSQTFAVRLEFMPNEQSA